jgi:molybdopterin-guanine dinucleotide biosynthesis protein
MLKETPVIVGVGGFASNVGKTTLMCELLKELPGWEAIKTTRGHYRSCGKDPEACCVSDQLGEVPTVRSGRKGTYAAGKDTGRYWDAGAANVHWVIATDEQVEAGILEALTRVRSAGVLIEGNSFSRYVTPDFMIMVRRRDDKTIKKSARVALSQCSAIYVSSQDEKSETIDLLPENSATLVVGRNDLPELIMSLRELVKQPRQSLHPSLHS